MEQDNKTRLNRSKAAAIAPALRASLYRDGGFPLLRFYEEAPRAGAALQLKHMSETEASAFVPDLSGTDLVVVDGLGSFIIAQDAAELNRKAIEAALPHTEGPARELPAYSRLYQKVAIVTGSAQGFGAGIAVEMAKQGALLAIADLNLPLAETVAADLNASYGANTAIAVAVNVGDEASVAAMVEDVVLAYGGLDILVSNAGVLRAGGLEEMDLQSFEFVTKINYTAYFLCTKYAARPMRIQNAIAQGTYTDIIQVNSKSVLEGSNKNFAYAGGKFGGIGLTQSFAKELVADHIKVNSVCPGNYYEGPLWSDPEKGLFVQYLKAGKVEGAQTVEDVYKFYTKQVPMKKGCSPLDVARAIFYLVEQQNETGQALPVTGGQTMLN